MDEIYDKYYSKVYNYVLKKTRNKEDAEDLTNSVFVAIFEYLNKNIKIEKLENLIFKIASNLWYMKVQEYEKNKKVITYDKTSYLGYEVAMLDKVIYKEIITNLDALGLTTKEKLCFKLYYIDDLPIKEISENLKMKPANIKYFLYSARNKIKENYYG